MAGKGRGREGQTRTVSKWLGALKGDSKQGFGRSKGGFTTQIHLRTNAEGLPIATEITGGNVSDYKGYMRR